jgi:hypothetical protein
MVESIATRTGDANARQAREALEVATRQLERAVRVMQLRRRRMERALRRLKVVARVGIEPTAFGQ